MRIWCKPMFGALALVLLMPCSSRAAAAPPAKIVVTFGGLNERSGVLFVAKDAGIFQKHGLDADVVGVRSGPVGMAALAAGETRFHGGSATGASIGAMASGLDLVFLAGLINKLDGLFVVAPSIRSPADLKGKKIGVQSIGGGAWMFAMLAFDHCGLNPERDNIQFRVIGDQSVTAQALATGGIIDGAYLGYTFGPQLERQGFRVLRVLGDLLKMGIPFQGLGIMGRRSFVDRSADGRTSRSARFIFNGSWVASWGARIAVREIHRTIISPRAASRLRKMTAKASRERPSTLRRCARGAIGSRENGVTVASAIERLPPRYKIN